MLNLSNTIVIMFSLILLWQQISVPMSVEFEEINKQREANDENLVMVDFTDEEGYGKYLDLHECYNKFLNIKGKLYHDLLYSNPSIIWLYLEQSNGCIRTKSRFGQIEFGLLLMEICKKSFTAWMVNVAITDHTNKGVHFDH